MGRDLAVWLRSPSQTLSARYSASGGLLPLEPTHLLLSSLHRVYQARMAAKDVMDAADSATPTELRELVVRLAANQILIARAHEDVIHDAIRARDGPRRTWAAGRFLSAIRRALSAFLQELQRE